MNFDPLNFVVPWVVKTWSLWSLSLWNFESFDLWTSHSLGPLWVWQWNASTFSRLDEYFLIFSRWKWVSTFSSFDTFFYTGISRWKRRKSRVKIFLFWRIFFIFFKMKARVNISHLDAYFFVILNVEAEERACQYFPVWSHVLYMFKMKVRVNISPSGRIYVLYIFKMEAQEKKCQNIPCLTHIFIFFKMKTLVNIFPFWRIFF